MAFDPQMADSLNAMILADTKLSSQRTNTIGENALQALTVVQGVVVQAQASQSDDPGLIAALQAAVGSPKQGAMS